MSERIVNVVAEGRPLECHHHRVEHSTITVYPPIDHWLCMDCGRHLDYHSKGWLQPTWPEEDRP